jgi:hypothetical protein
LVSASDSKSMFSLSNGKKRGCQGIGNQTLYLAESGHEQAPWLF